MTARTFAIGDVHGCADALQALLEQIQPTSIDTLIFLGDYVDRGPDSAAVVETLADLVSRCHLIPLLGNHEVMMLASATDPTQMRFWCQHGGAETLASYGGSLANVPPPHRAFFHNCLRSFETETHIFVHANYDPVRPLEEQPDDVLLWQHIMRDVPKPHASGKTVIVGHTPQLDGLPQDMGHLKLLDTFCYGGQWLSAMDVDQGIVYQANNHGETRELEFE